MEKNMTEGNIRYIITSATNNYGFLKHAFETYEEGKSYFQSREYIIELMLRNQKNLRDAKAEAKRLGLKLEDQKNNSSN